MPMALSQNGSLYSAKLGASSHKVASMMHAPITNKHTFGAVTKPSTLLRLNFPPLNHNNHTTGTQRRKFRKQQSKINQSRRLLSRRERQEMHQNHCQKRNGVHGVRRCGNTSNVWRKKGHLKSCYLRFDDDWKCKQLVRDLQKTANMTLLEGQHQSSKR